MTDQAVLQAYLDFAIGLAKEAGSIIKDATESRMSGKHNHFQVKYDNPTDLVTETDQAVERFIKARISATYPDHKFIGEETMAEGVDSEYTDAPTWIVDPIDGTTNFIHGFPAVAVSIGLAISRQPVVGVIYCPLTDELYSAAKGLGAYLNLTRKLPLFCAPLEDLSRCLVATEAGSDRSPAVFEQKIKFIQAVLRKREHADDKTSGQAHSVRCTGSAAINMCHVAKGCVDVYWEVGCWEWDVAAAVVIVQESGGIVVSGGTTPGLRPVNIFSRKFMTIRAAPEEGSQAKIAHQMWEIIPEIDAPRKPVPGGFEP